MFTKILKFIKYDVWRIQLRNLSKTRSFFVRYLRIILLTFRGIDEDKCLLRASALTFYSLLSVVPIVAMAFGIAKGFGFEKLLEKQLIENFPGQREILEKIISFAYSLLASTRGGVVAGIGVAILFWTVIKVLGNIEISFNDIWGIKKKRSLGRRFTDYLSIMLICPVVFILSSSITVFLTAQVTFITQTIVLPGYLKEFLLFGLRALPYIMLWFVFSFIYIFIPNTKVNALSAILAGISAGTLYQFVQWAYINFQIGVSRFNAIYGSFAALPLFLVWLQLSWLILLLGAEIAFAHQNVHTYEFEPDCLKISYAFKKLISLGITNLLVKDFHEGKAPLTARQISNILDIPVRLTRQIIFELMECGLISEVREEDFKKTAYQPARDINFFTVKYVIDTIERHGTDNIPVAETEELSKLSACLKDFGAAIEKLPANVNLKDI
jgi:membrane protein